MTENGLPLEVDDKEPEFDKSILVVDELAVTLDILFKLVIPVLRSKVKLVEVGALKVVSVEMLAAVDELDSACPLALVDSDKVIVELVVEFWILELAVVPGIELFKPGP